jgi:hypothetical protein
MRRLVSSWVGIRDKATQPTGSAPSLGAVVLLATL